MKKTIRYFMVATSLLSSALAFAGSYSANDEFHQSFFLLENQAKFAQEECKVKKLTAVMSEKNQPACFAKFNDAFKARLKDQYNLADQEHVANECKTHSVDCKDPANLESLTRHDHNKRVKKSSSF